MQFILENKLVILAVLLAVSEGLALLPGLKSNGILDGVIKFLKALGAKDKSGA
jgi:hypothetical protein